MVDQLKRKKLVLAFITLVILLINAFQSTHAAIYEGSVNTNNFMGQLRVTDKINQAYIYQSPLFFDMNVRIDVDPIAETIRWLDFSVVYPNVQLSKTDDYTVGFGQTVSITTIVNFNPFEVTFDYSDSHESLRPGLAGDYFIDAVPWVDETLITFTGNYQIIGATETKSGLFTTTVPFQLLSGLPNPIILSTSGYPDSLALSSFGYTLHTNSIEPDIFTGEIDGVYKAIGVGDSWLLPGAESIVLNAVSTPIPSTLILYASGLIALVGIKRRPKT